MMNIELAKAVVAKLEAHPAVHDQTEYLIQNEVDPDAPRGCIAGHTLLLKGWEVEEWMFDDYAGYTHCGSWYNPEDWTVVNANHTMSYAGRFLGLTEEQRDIFHLEPAESLARLKQYISEA